MAAKKRVPAEAVKFAKLFATMHTPIALVLCPIILGFAAGIGHMDQSSELSQPNIVLIYIDDLGWNDVGFNGSRFYETPHIDQLARDGIIFSHAYANAPNCAPSRASLMTGLYTPRHRIYTVGSPARGQDTNRRMIPAPNIQTLELEYVTLAEHLRESGYATAYVGKWHLGGDGFLPQDQGFDFNAGGYASGSPRGGYFSPYKNPQLSDGPAGEHLTDRLTEEALGFIGKNAAQPFFLHLSYYAVHTPLQAKSDLIAKYEQKSPAGNQNNAVYAAMIENMDQNVGRILASLDSLGLVENTMVLFFSDNGGAMQATSNAPLRGYKGMLYEGGIRVPLAVKWPGKIHPKQVEETPVMGIDLLPTLLEVSGAPSAQRVDGLSLMPLLLGEGPIESRSLYWHFPAYLEMPRGFEGPWRTTPAGAIRHGPYKLIEFFEDDRLELYDLSSDIGEFRNLASERPELTSDLHARLKAWRIEVSADMPTQK